MLAMAGLAGGMADGALVMLAFGAGTLPALFAAGLAAARLRVLAQSTVLRRSAAAAYIALGAWFAFSAITGPAGHSRHPKPAAASRASIPALPPAATPVRRGSRRCSPFGVRRPAPGA